MDLPEIIETLRALPPGEQRGWWQAAAVLLAVVALYLLLEALWMRRRGGLAAWLALRIATLFATPLTFVAVVLPARATHGMEGLAVFYGLLFTVAPLIWFGMHGLAGRLAGVSSGRWLPLAIIGLVLALLPLWVYQFAEPAVREAAREIGRRRLPSGPSDPLPFDVGPVRRFTLPSGEAVHAQSLRARQGVQLRQVEERRFGLWQREPGTDHPAWCRAGDDVHLMWSSKQEAPYLRLRWAEGVRDGRAEHSPAETPGSPAETFLVGFRPDGFDLAVPVARSRIDARVRLADGSHHAVLQLPMPAQQPPDPVPCILPGHRFPLAQDQGEVDAVVLTFRPLTGGQATRGVFLRPGAPPYR